MKLFEILLTSMEKKEEFKTMSASAITKKMKMGMNQAIIQLFYEIQSQKTRRMEYDYSSHALWKSKMSGGYFSPALKLETRNVWEHFTH